jgi:hypothetical protein
MWSWQVLHHDKVMLEQEWCYLASHTPYDAFMERSHSFQDSENKGGADFFNPIEECIWRLHLVTLPRWVGNQPPAIYLSVYLSIDLSIYLLIYLSFYLSIQLSIYLSISESRPCMIAMSC